MSSKKIPLVAMSFVLLIGISILCPTASAQNGGSDRPFHGTAVGTVVGQNPPNELLLSYTGNATHLGFFSRSETLYLNPNGSFTGQLVFNAANGDQLNASITGQFISATNAVGTYSFTGGTGRFIGATGQAEFQAFTPNGFNVAVQFSGRIRY